MAEDRRIYGTEAIAKHFGVTARTIQLWVKRGMPHDGRWFDPVACGIWRRDQEAARGGGGGADDDDPESTVHWTRRDIKARAEKREMELAILKGEYIAITSLEPMLSARAWVYRQGLLGFEQKLPPLIANAFGLPPLIANAFGLPPEALQKMVGIIRQEAREVLGNVLRALTLPGGQTVEWEKCGDGSD